MGFFDPNRKRLAEQGIDPARLPPGQYLTERFPVLHVGDVPRYDLDRWTLEIGGLVAQPYTLGFAELTALPTAEVTTDIHCVTAMSADRSPPRCSAPAGAGSPHPLGALSAVVEVRHALDRCARA